MPTCWIIAGPNGAGKTTFALEFLPATAKCSHFINADMIAAGLSPLAPENGLITASKIFLSEINTKITTNTDFALETTLAGRSYIKLINSLHARSWHVKLIYLALPNAEMSELRVAERVRHGGHSIPLNDIRRRYPRSLKNLLYIFSPLVDHCLCFMNDGDSPVLVFEQEKQNRVIINQPYFQLLLENAL
ncbi:hypothetical protein QE250_07075 [Chromatiaceae bacterium AAb-1]|nr:hypothetical protein [Chromatiaceae bacterium AAb-1]